MLQIFVLFFRWWFNICEDKTPGAINVTCTITYHTRVLHGYEWDKDIHTTFCTLSYWSIAQRAMNVHICKILINTVTIFIILIQWNRWIFIPVHYGYGNGISTKIKAMNWELPVLIGEKLCHKYHWITSNVQGKCKFESQNWCTREPIMKDK